ncbi:uncharacterized protein LOC144150153 [Haemaphysalis longicornis]
MSSDKQITECFKMKKPKSSPPPATSGELATPKRRIGKSKLTPNKLRRPTSNGSKEGSPQNHPDRAYSSPPVDLDNLIVDQFLCSQDVVHNDVVWDCTSPRNRMLSGNARGGSDVESLVKLFRTKPQEVKPATSTLNIITASFTKTSTLGRAATPRKKTGKGKKKVAASSATSARAVVEQMQELWNIVQQSKQDGSQPLPSSPATEATPPLPLPQTPSEQPAGTTTSDGLGEVALKVEAEVAPQRDVATTTTANVVPPAAAAGVLISDDDDYDKWIMDDDSILAAATQDIDMPSPARKYSKTPTRQPAQAKPSGGGGGAVTPNVGSPIPRKTPLFVSPLRRPANSSTPKGASATRKSPRLSLLSLNRTPSPLRPPPVKPDKAADNAPNPPLEACSRKSSTEVLFEDDDEDDLLDQICSTYEQQQQMDTKVAATAVSAYSAKFSTAATATLKPAERASPAVKPVAKPSSGTFAVPSANTASSSLRTDIPKLTTAAGDPAGKKIGPQGVVSNGSANPSRPKASLPAKCAASLLRQVSTSTARPPGQSTRPTTYGKPAAFGVPSHSKPSTVATNQPKVVLERCAAVPPKASLGVKSSSLSSRSSAPSKPHMHASSAPVGRPPVGAVQSGGKADTGLDFDDDDFDLATPEVMSWLEKVESQPSKNQRCTPEEIAKKREEALQRRRLKAKGPTEWTGRLRVSK